MRRLLLGGCNREIASSAAPRLAEGEEFDSVAGEDAVAGDDGEILFESLGDEQAVEGIAVVQGELRETSKVRTLNLKDLNRGCVEVAVEDVADASRSLQLPVVFLDRQFPF